MNDSRAVDTLLEGQPDLLTTDEICTLVRYRMMAGRCGDRCGAAGGADIRPAPGPIEF